MFGNLKGWIISGVIFGLVALVLVAGGLLVVPPVSEPSGMIKLAEKIELPTDPKQFLPPMDKDCDAAEMYRQAIHEYDLNQKLYDDDGKYGKSPKAAAEEKPKGIQLIVDAADCGRMNLFGAKPEQVVHYNATWPDLAALNKMGVRTLQVGMIHRLNKDLPQAEKHLNAAFVLGYRLYEERLVWEELNTGLNLMINAATQLGRLAKDQGDAARSDALAQFAADLDKYKTDKVVPVALVLTSIESRIIGSRGGDIFGLLQQSPERVWKVEALLSLGRMKYNTPNRGDQVGAQRVVKQYLADPDPAVKQAAKLAEEMTIERYRMLGA